MRRAIVLIMLGTFLAAGSAPVLAQNTKQKKECKQDSTCCKKNDKKCCKQDQKSCCKKK